MRKVKPLQKKVKERISRKRGNVILRSDFSDLGGYDQVGRALRELVHEGKLVRISQGVYAKAKTSPLTGETIPVKSLPTLTREALARLGVKVVPTEYEEAYNSSRSTQVPTGRYIATDKRVRRLFAYGRTRMSVERVTAR